MACVTLGFGAPEATEADRAAEVEWPAAAAAAAAETDWAADWAAETALGDQVALGEQVAGEALLRGGLSGLVTDIGEEVATPPPPTPTTTTTPTTPTMTTTTTTTTTPLTSSPRPLPADAPTAAEMEPGSEAMLLRAAAAKARLTARVLTPYEVAALICDEDDDDDEGDDQGVEFLDVRTAAQRATHEINGRGPMTPRGARSASLDDMVGGRVALPSPEQLVVLVCSRGPKSLVALDWLAEACPRAVCVDGGITAWDVAKLPTESTSAVPPP